MDRIVADFHKCDAGVGIRTGVKHLVSKDDALFKTLIALGIAGEVDNVYFLPSRATDATLTHVSGEPQLLGLYAMDSRLSRTYLMGAYMSKSVGTSSIY